MSKLTPQQAEAALQEAVALHRQGQLAAAEKNYARILKSFPDQFDALHLLGLLKLQTGKAGEAQRLITAALRIDPSSTDALANLGLVLARAEAPGRGARAASTRRWRSIPIISRRSPIAATSCSISTAPKRRWSASIRVLAREPRHLPARVNRGNALLALGRGGRRDPRI